MTKQRGGEVDWDVMADEEQIEPVGPSNGEEAGGAAEPSVPESGAVAPVGEGAAPVSALNEMAKASVQPAAYAFGPRVYGRRYGFLCGHCSSRLEATDSMAGQTGSCPTCGNTIVIPILDNRGRLIDPTTHEIIKQDPHPVHAYAAAGHRAPTIVATGTGDERAIECPRCRRLNSLAINNCAGCGLPFTMDGTFGDSISGTNTWAVASMVLGIVGLAGGFCLGAVPPILALIFGIIAMRGMARNGTGQGGQGLAISGIIMGVLGIVFFGLALIYSGVLR